MSEFTGLIDDTVLAEMRREIAASFDTTVIWYKQKYDENGHPISDLYGRKHWEDPITVPARVTNEVEESYLGGQTVQHRFIRATIPPNTGVRAGDVVLLKGEQFDTRAPIVGVAQIPSESRSAFEFVTLGIGM